MEKLTIEQILTNIERGLSLAAGTDVQIHAEDELMFSLQSAYTMFMEESFAYSNLYFRTDNLDLATNEIAGTYKDDCRAFADIHSIYFDLDTNPATLLSARTNPLTANKPNMVIQTDNENKLFKVHNRTAERVSIWYRKRLSQEVWDNHLIETVVDLDPLLLTLAVIHQYLVTEDSNRLAIQEAQRKVFARRDMLRKRDWQHALDKQNQNSGSVMEWR